MSVDYKALLAKYIQHVAAHQGVTCLRTLYRQVDGLYAGMSDKVAFSGEEMAALVEAEKTFA